jgi:hypothetical protein
MGGGVFSMGTAPPTQSPEAQPVFNPQLDRHGRPEPKRKIAVKATEVYNIASDNEDDAMDWQTQEAVAKDYMAEERRAKNEAMVSHASARLAEVENMKNRTAIKTATMAQNGVLNKHLSMAQSFARARQVNQLRENTAQAINQSIKEAEMNRWRQYLAEQKANQQRARADQIKQNVAKKEAQDAEQRLREAQIENSRMNMSRMIAIRNRGREQQSDSEETTFYYEGDDEEPKQTRKPVKPPAKKAKKAKLDSEEAKEALNKGLSKASRVVPGKTAISYLKKGLKEAEGIVPNKVVKGAKAIRTMKNIKASVEPQPGSSYTAIKTPRKKHRTGQMEKVRAVALPVH